MLFCLSRKNQTVSAFFVFAQHVFLVQFNIKNGEHLCKTSKSAKKTGQAPQICVINLNCVLLRSFSFLKQVTITSLERAVFQNSVTGRVYSQKNGRQMTKKTGSRQKKLHENSVLVPCGLKTSIKFFRFFGSI